MEAFYVPAGTHRSGPAVTMFGTAPLHIKVWATDTDGRFMVGEIIGAGFGPPRHLHYEQDEWFYVTEGTFLIEVGDEQFDAKAGDSIFAPRGVSHAWAPTGEVGRLLFVLEPAGSFDNFVHDASALGRLPNPEEASAIFEANGMKITGPPLDVAKTGFEGA